MDLGADFEVVRRLGGGAVAEVYLVRQKDRANTVVVKVVRKNLTQNVEVVGRFLDEIKLVSGLSHPQLVKHLGAGRMLDGRVYLITESLEGEDLQSHLQAQGPIGSADAIRLMLPLCEVLEYLHQRNVIHRDLKPDNVFLVGGLYKFTPRLIDFGLAHFEGPRAVRTAEGVLVSTPEYTAPECVSGKRADARSDLYALGALLHAVLTGAPPFVDPNPAQLLLKHLKEPPPPLPAAAKQLEPVVHRLLAKDPADRFPSAAEVAWTLQEIAARDAAEDVWAPTPNETNPITLSDALENGPEAPPLEKVGDILGNYELVKFLGEGSMGRVFQGRHTRLGRQVALKLLRAEHARSPELIQRFFQEARTVNQINHEHIVEIIDFVSEVALDGTPRAYCVMELLVGENLGERLKREPLSVQRTAMVTRQVCEALSEAHRAGVVHRDVKPDNVYLVERSGVRDYVKVLDFGVAKLVRPLGDLPVGATVNGAIIGTPTYMAPEQASGLGAEERSDIYSVGVVLYEALAGKVPFAGTNFGQLVVQIVSQAPPPLPESTIFGEVLPNDLRTLVERCLAKDVTQRPASMDEVSAALEPFTHEDWKANQPAQVRAPAKRKPRWIAPVAGLAVLGIAGIAFATYRAHQLSQTPTKPVGETANIAVAPPAAPISTPLPAPEPEKLPERIALAVDTSPSHAQVRRVDTGEVLGTTPLRRDLPRADAELVLELQLEGYKPLQRKVRLDANVFLDTNLVAEPKLAKPSKPKPPKSEAQKKVSHDGVIDAFPE